VEASATSALLGLIHITINTGTDKTAPEYTKITNYFKEIFSHQIRSSKIADNGQIGYIYFAMCDLAIIRKPTYIALQRDDIARYYQEPGSNLMIAIAANVDHVVRLPTTGLSALFTPQATDLTEIDESSTGAAPATRAAKACMITMRKAAIMQRTVKTPCAGGQRRAGGRAASVG
jgi:glutamine phosphoribosylpyrophosphate amidotransferase